MKTNYHTHTTRCMHATGSDEDYVLSAIKGGYQELGFSDHTPWKYHTDYVADMRMLPEELPGYVESLRSLREKYRDQISIKIGLECEYFPTYIHWLKEKIKEYQLDYILFGNHHYHTDEKFPYFGHHTRTLICWNSINETPGIKVVKVQERLHIILRDVFEKMCFSIGDE